jgi:hypothetical protein
MRLRKLLLVMALVVMAVPAAHAQNGVYATYTSATMTNIGGNVPHMNGATVGFFVQDRRSKVFKGGVDFRGNFLNGNYSTSSDQGLAGLRLVVLPPRVHIAPYAEFLIGVANSLLFTSGKGETLFMSAFVAGADYKLARHVDWRVVDFTYSRVNAKDPFNPVMVGTGLVARF